MPIHTPTMTGTPTPTRTARPAPTWPALDGPPILSRTPRSYASPGAPRGGTLPQAGPVHLHVLPARRAQPPRSKGCNRSRSCRHAPAPVPTTRSTG
jgi:hypothetical protein